MNPEQPGSAKCPYSTLSYWHETCNDAWDPRPGLPGDLDADVVIVGAGYTGLWTAYYLKQRDPSLRVIVLDKNVAGFGASGRNGGWCSAIFPASFAKITSEANSDAAVRMQRAMIDTLSEIETIIQRESILCDYSRGGYISAARNRAQETRATDEVKEWRALGFAEDDIRLTGQSEARQIIGATKVINATFTPHCAALHPAKLVRGLARVAEAHGVSLYEQTSCMTIESGKVTTERGTVRAEVVIRATEGYTPTVRASHRDLIPMYSMMIATEPLDKETWEKLKLSRRETFSDKRHLRIYGQRTADNRIAFGGRGAPYHYGSTVRPLFDSSAKVSEMLHKVLVDLFPDLINAEITHRWGGNLGIPRDWFPRVGFSTESGLGFAGGYVGDGVATANLAGRTLADLVTRSDSDLSRLPWARGVFPKWEPEPFRWLGVNAVTKLFSVADRTEAVTQKPSRLAAGFWHVISR